MENEDREITERECQYCGEEITDENAYVGNDGVFCSEECLDNYMASSTQKRTNGGLKQIKVEKKKNILNELVISKEQAESMKERNKRSIVKKR